MKTQPFGDDRLISWRPLPEWNGEMCPWVPASASLSLSAALQQSPGSGETAASLRPSEQARGERIERDPLRVIRDPYPSYSVVAMDVERGEVVVGDENLFQILVYDRLANTPPGAAFTEPKRVIAGPQTGIEFVCGLYVDQPSGDIYAIHADTAAVMQVFTREQQGNVQPVRELHTGGEARGRGFVVDSENEELFIASQHNSAVAVWHKYAEGEEPPIRLLQGDRTLLANPSGLALDKRNDLLFVANQGQVSSRSAAGVDPELLASNRPLGIRLAVRGSGRFLPPSINVYHRTASGDTPPLRVIGGPRTQLNWPAAIVVDERRGELFVANDTGNSVLVFRADASGDVAPIRVLKGPDTGLDSPAGVFVDAKNDELWVANYGNHSLTVFSTTADGNTAPLRTIRSGPAGNRALMIGNPGAVAYDSKREQILAPN
ncbi:MAG: beta-propeller fold lactonase family protein [Acidobacteria bacterium]|nr:beta-propeller fold lactonase family protein [Acidobacteriota bacterium]